MRDAMLSAMLALPDVQVLSLHDSRLSAPDQATGCHVLQESEHPLQALQALIAEADLVWLVAPETGGVLQQLSAMVLDAGRQLLSSAPDAVALATSKWQTYLHLKQHGLPMVETAQWPTYLAAGQGWVIKPDDGVSCDGTRLVTDQQALQRWLAQDHAGEIIQPYMAGTAASLSMLCRHGQAWLLSVNQQLIHIADGHIHYRGSVVNADQAHWSACAQIASQVAAAVPGLFGYVGVDLLLGENGQLHVLEVNPRLTTSFAGLEAAIAYNPARLLLDLFYNENFMLPLELQRNKIEIKLND